MRRRPLVLSTVLALGAALVATPASARPPQPTCGETLTRSTTLLADLVCTSAPGLRLAPGVTLNLGGHTLRGPGSGNGVEVAWSGPVVVRNGTVAGWGSGIDTWADADPDDPGVEDGPLTVTRVTFEDARVGVDASGESGTGRYRKATVIERSTFRSLEIAVEGGWFAEVDVRASTFSDNASGVWSGGSATVTDSTFTRNGVAVRGADAGLTVTRSTFLDNGTGVGSLYNAFATVEASRFVGNGVGVDTANGLGAVVRDSRFTSNDLGVGVGELGVRVEGNDLRGNGVGIGTRVPDAVVYDATILDNTLRLNGDGIVIENGDASVQVGGNDVRRSTGKGIWTPGVTDLGGNVARGNGTEPQCVGVVCAAS
ncbi:right-handed parallel beta-helix repeat-containing protein [Cellulomonas fimi]|uniref:right-handed parallel beta-helix repeat-containing protein n=1 Tax=Cellulomonas fimi TaxID=1708 RepID=UPI00234CA30D|nr:right-handed parallel beta-helix repeat-containing protein [Cellulomonas fimi]MDC7120983.1 right-handed parallel beta-helix repeat-containing protein [Cellulomonas fimi]